MSHKNVPPLLIADQQQTPSQSVFPGKVRGIFTSEERANVIGTDCDDGLNLCELVSLGYIIPRSLIRSILTPIDPGFSTPPSPELLSCNSVCSLPFLGYTLSKLIKNNKVSF